MRSAYLHLFQREYQVVVGSESGFESGGKGSDVKTRNKAFLGGGGGRGSGTWRRRSNGGPQRKLFVSLDKVLKAEIVRGDLAKGFQLVALLSVEKWEVGRHLDPLILM